jgi:hypothetical protein
VTDVLASIGERSAASPASGFWGGTRFLGSECAEWLPPATIAEQHSTIYQFKPASQVWMAMSPERYLQLVREAWGWQGIGLDDASWAEELHQREMGWRDRDHVRAQLVSRAPLDPAVAGIDIERLRAVAQEGAHRALLAQSLGFRRIPVVVFAHRFGVGYVPATPEFRRFVAAMGESVACPGLPGMVRLGF